METPNLFDLHIDGESTGFLKEISRWAKFLSVTGFVMVGFMVLISLVIIAIGDSQPFLEEALRTSGNSNSTMTGVIYLVMALISIIPYVYLFQFANKMKAALRSSEQEALNRAFSNLKSCFKFVGVFTIVMFGFLALCFIVMIIAGIAGVQN